MAQVAYNYGANFDGRRTKNMITLEEFMDAVQERTAEMI